MKKSIEFALSKFARPKPADLLKANSHDEWLPGDFPRFSEHRGVFKALSNTYDGVFGKNS